MKKLLSFALLLCSMSVLCAQNEVSIKYGENTYNNGDTIYVVVDEDASHFYDFVFHNNTGNDLTDMVFTKHAVEQHGIDIWGLCTGFQCVQDDNSAKFTIPANGDYTDFYMDINIDGANSWCLYNVSVHNSSVTYSAVMRMQNYALGINEVKAQASVNVYPNPAQGQVNVRFNVEQPATLVVYDAQGRTVSQQTICGNGTTALNNLPAGVYAYGIAGGKMSKLIVK